MSEISEAAIEAGCEALFAANASEWGPIRDDDPTKAQWYRHDMNAILAAALPALRAHIAGQIAAGDIPYFTWVGQVRDVLEQVSLQEDAEAAIRVLYPLMRDHFAEIARRVGGADAGGETNS